MQITVFGASGKVGSQVVDLALKGGFEVVAFVHSRNPFDPNPKLAIVKGDIADKSAVAVALKGSDAVISCLGSWGTKDKNILTQGMKTIIPAMEELKIPRLITLTGSGAFWSGDTPNIIDKSGHLMAGMVASKILKDSEKHLRLLDTSSLAWTCVRAPVMTQRPTYEYKLSMDAPWLLAMIPRHAVAKSLVDQIDATDFLRRAPHIHII